MTPLLTKALPLVETADGSARAALLPACRWFTDLRVIAVAGDSIVTTGEGETCALLLAGTFDLVGGSTVWQSRGARITPFGGRPVAVFLPPRTRFLASNGSGEILMIAARQPEAPPPTGRDALRQSPLLQMAGSGKAFDPGTGEWRPAETFPTAPESLPPRRIERLLIGGIEVERVFAADYKAATLTVDEVVLPAGSSLHLLSLPLPPATECLLYVRTEGELVITAGGTQRSLSGEQAVCWGGPPGDLTLKAASRPVYAAMAYAGK